MSEHESTETEVLDSTDSVEPADLSEQLGGDAEGDSTDASAAADDPIAAAMQALAAGGHTEKATEGDEILPVQFAQLEQPPAKKVKPRFGRLNNVNVDVTVELGRKEMSVREISNLKEQDVIDLTKLAGEAFDILINSRPFADGEIVVVTDLMAVRITRLIDCPNPEEEEE